MAKYIELDALVAEIEKIIADETESIKSFEHNKNASEVQRSNARIGVLTHLRSLLNTLEVKEVDLEEEMNEALTHLTDKDMRGWFRYFFELGIKAQKGESYV